MRVVRQATKPANRLINHGLKQKCENRVISSIKDSANLSSREEQAPKSADSILQGGRNPPSRSGRQLDPQRLNLYKVTEPPNTSQLKYATEFFHKHRPALLASFPEFRLFPDTSAPEVCFLGRSNVGKSSVINALLRGYKSESSAHVSKKAGRTTTMNAFAVGPSIVGLKTHGVNRAGQVVRWEGAPKQWVGKGGLILIDLQGYGFNSQEKWGQEIMKLLTKRKQLRRAFVLIDSSAGLKRNDIDLLSLLREHGIPHQIVLTKADKILFHGGNPPAPNADLSNHIQRIKLVEDQMWKLFTDNSRWSSTGQTALCDILVTIAEKNMAADWRLGIDSLRFAVLQAAGLDCDEHGRKRSAPALNLAATERP